MSVWRAVLTILVLLTSGGIVASAQQRSMRVWLNTGTGEQKMQRLVTMGVGPEAAEVVAISSGPEVEWLPLHTKSDKQLAVLFIPCSGDSAFAYLMKQAANDWQAADHVGFDCHYDGSVWLEVAAIVKKAAEDVLVHHACVSHGTGFVQQDFQVLAVRHDKLKSVLDTTEILKAADEGLDKYQRSSFVVVPSSVGRVIEETRSTTLNGRLSVDRRYFRWVASEGAYRPSRFVPVSVQLPVAGEKSPCRK
jgi:hypothetical protein